MEKILLPHNFFFNEQVLNKKKKKHLRGIVLPVEGVEFVLPLEGPFTGDAVVPDDLCEPLAHAVKTQAELLDERHEQRNALPRDGVLHVEEVAVEAVVAADQGKRVREPDHRGLVHEDLIPHAPTLLAFRYQRACMPIKKPPFQLHSPSLTPDQPSSLSFFRVSFSTF